MQRTRPHDDSWRPLICVRCGEVTEQQEFGFLQLVTVARDCGMRTYLAGLPVWLQRYVGIPLLARLGRLRGYRASAW